MTTRTARRAGLVIGRTLTAAAAIAVLSLAGWGYSSHLHTDYPTQQGGN